MANGNPDGKVVWWIMGIVGSLIVFGAGAFVTGISGDVSKHGERIATTEAKVEALETSQTEIKAGVIRLEIRLEKVAEKIGAK